MPQKKVRPSFYPIGIYAVPSTNDFAAVKCAGFNLLVGHENDAYLEAARAAGLSVLAAPNTSAGPPFNPAAARNAVKNYDGHPALWAWHLVDEADLNAIPPQQVIQARRCLEDVHARKPTALTLCRGYEALHCANLADMTMIDRYRKMCRRTSAHRRWDHTMGFAPRFAFRYNARVMHPRKKPLAALLVLGVCVGWPVAAHYRAKNKVAAYRRQLIAHGEKLSVAELTPLLPAAEDNGADGLMSATW